MMSLELIRELSDDAAATAAEENYQPLVLADSEKHPNEVFNAPFIGDYIPEGWELEDTLFVDSSGFGADDEPALTIGQLFEIVKQHPDAGWAITEQGQFQIYMGRYGRAA